jgi:hypothetical protein
MSWTDHDMDQLFRNAEAQQDFNYDPHFFEDIERQLPVKRSRKSGAWWISSFVMFGLFSLLFVTRLSDAVITSPLKSESTFTSVKKTQGSQAGVQTKDSEIPVITEETKQSEPILNKNNESLELVTAQDASEQTLEILEYSNASGELTTLNYRELAKVPVPVAEIQFFPPFSLKRKIRTSWYIALDGGLQQSWTTEPTVTNMDGLAGLSSGVDVHLGRWIIGTGLSFSWQNLSHLEIRERTKIYGFGYSTYDNAYSFTGVASLNVPLRVGFTKGRHQFNAGLDAGRNLFASMRRVQSMNGEVFRMTQGITDVSLLNKYSLQPQIGYAYQINKQVSVGVNVKYQVLHPLSSDRFEGVQNQHPWSAGITLKAALTK